MDDLISRKGTINIIKNYFGNLIMEQPTEIDEDGEEIFVSTAKVNDFLAHSKELCKKIYYLPKNVPDRNVGKWIYGESEIGNDGYYCSVCGNFVPWKYDDYDIDFIKEFLFCNKCGADMREKKKTLNEIRIEHGLQPINMRGEQE